MVCGGLRSVVCFGWSIERSGSYPKLTRFARVERIGVKSVSKVRSIGAAELVAVIATFMGCRPVAVLGAFVVQIDLIAAKLALLEMIFACWQRLAGGVLVVCCRHKVRWCGSSWVSLVAANPQRGAGLKCRADSILKRHIFSNSASIIGHESAEIDFFRPALDVVSQKVEHLKSADDSLGMPDLELRPLASFGLCRWHSSWGLEAKSKIHQLAEKLLVVIQHAIREIPEVFSLCPPLG